MLPKKKVLSVVNKSITPQHKIRNKSTTQKQIKHLNSPSMTPTNKLPAVSAIPKNQTLNSVIQTRSSKNKTLNAVDKSQITIKDIEEGDWIWKLEKTCFLGCSPGLKGSSKIASFDMDETIISPKSNAKLAIDADDWRFLHKIVPEVINQLYVDGYKIVIFTNQAGIQKGHTKAEDIKTKVQNIAKLIKVEMQVFIASHQDQFRKPGTQMWRLLEQNNNGIPIDIPKSFFCGDAAGRKTLKHKDFADTDIKFAYNVGLEFKTPQNLYFGDKEIVQVQGFNPKIIPEIGEMIVGKGQSYTLKFIKKQMVILCGPSASGKSTFIHNYMPQYQKISIDTLKTKEKCYRLAENKINEGKSVVIDSTNPKRDHRRYFIDLAKKHDYKVRCFVFTTSKDICFHNDYQRKANMERKHFSEYAGSIPIHTFFKFAEKPQLSEGFNEILLVNFLAKFKTEADKKFYKQFSNR